MQIVIGYVQIHTDHHRQAVKLLFERMIRKWLKVSEMKIDVNQRSLKLDHCCMLWQTTMQTGTYL